LEDDFTGSNDSPLSILADLPGTHAYINLIIRDEEHVSDIISVLFGHSRTFDERTRRLYEAVADQIAIVLQNQRLLSDSNRRAEQLQRIASFGQSVQRSLDIPDLMQTMLTESVQTLPIDRMNIALHDTVQDALRVVAQYDEGNSSIAPSGGPIMNQRGSFAERAWETGEFVYVPDTLISAEARRTEAGGTRSLMIAPVRTRDRVFGLVNVGCLRPNAYTETDVAVFQQMVSQLAVALENAEEFAQSQRLAKNEALINDIASQLQQQMDMQRLLSVTLSEVGKALGAKRGRIRLAPTLEDGAGERHD
jgi:phosphoserine phosphatase RsbU/P